MTPGDWIAACTLAALIFGGLIHNLISLATVRNDVVWIKNALMGAGIIAAPVKKASG